DADWDIAAARVGRLVTELDEPAAIRLLGSLGATLEAELPEAARAEAEAVAAVALERLVAAWDERPVPVPVAALEGWLGLAARVSEPPAPPRLGATWIELLPTEPIDVRSREELVRFDEWLALAAVLAARAPRELDRFGFPEL